MQYVIVRCEDYARAGSDLAALLAGAKATHLQHLAQAGAAGVLRHRPDEPAIDRFELHRALVGLLPNDPEAAAGACCAAGINLNLVPEETGWCCELVTQHDGVIIDPTAGNISAEEGEALIRGLNGQLGSQARRWEVGHGAHHVFVATDAALQARDEAAVPAAELLVGRPWRRALPKGHLRDGLQLLIEEASKFLEGHPVNRVRVDLGENPANAIWLWGAVEGGPRQTLAQRTGRSGAVISSSFPMRGFAACAGFDWRSGVTSFEERALQQLMKGIAALSERRELVYIHLRVDSRDPVERLCAMERIDQLVLKPLTEWLPNHGPWRLLTAIDDRSTGSVPFVAIGTGLPQQPVAHLDALSLESSPLTFNVGHALFAWLTTQG